MGGGGSKWMVDGKLETVYIPSNRTVWSYEVLLIGPDKPRGSKRCLTNTGVYTVHQTHASHLCSALHGPHCLSHDLANPL